MNHFILLLVVAIFVTTGCAKRGSQAEPEKTQLEIREFQTRTFEIHNHHLVMKSIIHVLQDDGYMVKNASQDLGLVVATKEVGFGQEHWATSSRYDSRPKIHLAGFGFGVGFGVQNRFPLSRDSAHPTHQLIETTVNVSEFGDKVRVRASFQAKVFDNHERVVRVQHITDETFYQNFFAKVSKGIFLQEQNI